MGISHHKVMTWRVLRFPDVDKYHLETSNVRCIEGAKSRDNFLIKMSHFSCRSYISNPDIHIYGPIQARKLWLYDDCEFDRIPISARAIAKPLCRWCIVVNWIDFSRLLWIRANVNNQPIDECTIEWVAMSNTSLSWLIAAVWYCLEQVCLGIVNIITWSYVGPYLLESV